MASLAARYPFDITPPDEQGQKSPKLKPKLFSSHSILVPHHTSPPTYPSPTAISVKIIPPSTRPPPSLFAQKMTSLPFFAHLHHTKTPSISPSSSLRILEHPNPIHSPQFPVAFIMSKIPRRRNSKQANLNNKFTFANMTERGYIILTLLRHTQGPNLQVSQDPRRNADGWNSWFMLSSDHPPPKEKGGGNMVFYLQ